MTKWRGRKFFEHFDSVLLDWIPCLKWLYTLRLVLWISLIQHSLIQQQKQPTTVVHHSWCASVDEDSIINDNELYLSTVTQLIINHNSYTYDRKEADRNLESKIVTSNTLLWILCSPNSDQQTVQRISAFGINTNWNTDRHKKHSHISSWVSNFLAHQLRSQARKEKSKRVGHWNCQRQINCCKGEIKYKRSTLVQQERNHVLPIEK